MTAKKKRASTTPASASKKKPPAKPTAPPPKAPTPAPATAGGPEVKKYSALDAAALVLRETGQPLSCPELIAQMAAKGYWTSPMGKTPSATLYAALMREAKRKGDAARFVKTGPGRFAYRDTL
jgi:hypothetical protein